MPETTAATTFSMAIKLVVIPPNPAADARLRSRVCADAEAFGLQAVEQDGEVEVSGNRETVEAFCLHLLTPCTPPAVAEA